MSTLGSVELTIITVVLAVFFILLCVFIVELLRAVIQIRRVYKKAETFISNAKSAAETLNNMGKATKQTLPILRILALIFYNALNRKHNGKSS